MVTPVHRFQSIESVVNNGLRCSRSTGYHARPPVHCSPSVHYNGVSSNIRIPRVPQMGGSLEMVATAHNPTTRNRHSPTSKLKCGVWIFFALVTFFLAGSKYYFHGINIGVEALVFCALLVVVLIVGGMISLCEVIFSYAPSYNAGSPSTQATDQSENQETHNIPAQTSTANNTPQHPAEIPPPPYHIAVMLSPQNGNMDAIHVLRDSPPPSYEKLHP
ncbi:unnamed protein product [Acanthoscelides obtectus]|uniref:Uncharacterized protein n=1 Tax=Acanthoscelides obtectus TaxID=200917 RepID=A0A9P0NRY8_ACAOB|nr:unnamed protein product [Acanthoscelides obtectus]CAK1662148.1 hypothetical protein AOBTE_LOCUS23012 [Acanthoscelides obtectus]